MVFIALLGTQGVPWLTSEHPTEIGVAPRNLSEASYVLPPVILGQRPEHWRAALLPTIDLLWQAAGLCRSIHPDASGAWLKP